MSSPQHEFLVISQHALPSLIFECHKRTQNYPLRALHFPPAQWVQRQAAQTPGEGLVEPQRGTS